MSRSTSVIRVAAALVGLIIGVLGWVPASAFAASPSYEVVYADTYDNPTYDQPSNDVAPERGPPPMGVRTDSSAGQAVIDRGPHSAVALPCASSEPSAYTYDDSANLAQAASGSQSAQATGGVLSAFRQTGVAAKSVAATNKAGRAYPGVIDPRSGAAISFPGAGLSKVPAADRVAWGAKERGGYIKQWYDRGHTTPEGGWGGYHIHHIKPRGYGGSNDFDNLVPIPRDVHQQQFNSWWRDY